MERDHHTVEGFGGRLRPMMKALDNRWTLVLAVLWLTIFIGREVWPTSYWYTIREVYVEDAKSGEPLKMRVDRVIKRPILGDWSFTIRKIEPQGMVIVCQADGRGNYQPDAQLPDKLTSEWWSNGKCTAVNDPGLYTTNTSFLFHPPLFPDKQASMNSNVFEVTQ
jgi:hypothetical protein